MIKNFISMTVGIILLSISAAPDALSMEAGLRDKVVIVTGGASGIGEATVWAFAHEGAIPVIVDRNREAGNSVSEKLSSEGKSNLFVFADLTDMQSCGEAVETVISRFGQIDILVNNAGVNDGVGLERSPSDFSESLKKNLLHYFAMAHFALPELKKSKGVIVNVASKVAMTGQGGTSGYAAAKGGILALTREWAADLLKYNIRVNAVVPAEVNTPQYESWLQSLGANTAKMRKKIEHEIPFGNRMTSSSEIASQIVFLFSPMLSGHTTGQHLIVDEGYIHLDRAISTPPI